MQVTKPILQKTIAVLPMFQAIFPFDCMPAVSDTEKILAYWPGKTIDTHSKAGDPIRKGSGLWNAINERKIISEVVPKEIFGFSFRAVSMPIYDDAFKDIIVGAMGFGYSINTSSSLQDMAETIASSAQELNAVGNEFLNSAVGLDQRMDELSKSSNTMYQNLEKTDDILIFIEHLADKSKLLSLNALIEAARAGQHGRSFTVVAQEIQKMAENSAKSLDVIRGLLDGIQKEVKMVNNLIFETKDLSSQQAVASVQINKSIESLTKITENLSQISTQI